MAVRRMCDLPQKLIGEKIFTRIPITSLREVRSTCKSWDALTKTWILGNEATSTEQFLGFMIMDSKVCSLKFHREQKKGGKRKKKVVGLYINQVDLLNQVEISQIFHCDGLLLCVAKDESKLVLWNPYLCQTRSIGPRTNFNEHDRYALGYDMNRNHKILRFLEDCLDLETCTIRPEKYEIYDFSSNSWRVLEVTPYWYTESFRRGVSVKGNSYFVANEKLSEAKTLEPVQHFLLCFDFTREKFGPRLLLPFHSYGDDCVTLSCVRDDEQLAVLYYKEGLNDHSCGSVEIWVTTGIEPNSVSWTKFLRVEMRPFSLTGVKFDAYDAGSFFIDEEKKKVAVVFDLDGYIPTLNPAPARYHTAFILGEDRYFKSLCLGEAPNLGERCPRTGYLPEIRSPARVCSSSYRPSLVQINNKPPRKRKRSCGDD